MNEDILKNIDHEFVDNDIVLSFDCGSLEDAEHFESKVSQRVLKDISFQSEITEETNTEDPNYPWTTVSFRLNNFNSILNIESIINSIQEI